MCGGRLSAGPVPALLYSHAKYGDQNYGSRAECNWIVTAGTGSGRVRIRFESFDLELEQDCAYDFVQITDGFESSRSLGKFCGNKVRGLSSLAFIFFLVTFSVIGLPTYCFGSGEEFFQ